MRLELTHVLVNGVPPTGQPIPLAYGSEVELGVTWHDADFVPAKPPVYELLRDIPLQRDGRGGHLVIAEEFPGVPAVGGLTAGDVADARLVFADGRPVETRSLTTNGAFWRFRATATERPMLDMGDGLTFALPEIQVGPRPVYVRRPRFGVYDEWDDKEALVATEEGLQKATVGIDRYMQSVSGRTKPSIVNGAFRNYITIRGAKWVEGSTQAKTARHFPTPTVVSCIWFHNDPAMRYSEAGVRELVDGKFDEDIRATIRSYPLDVMVYLFPLHEADLKGIGGVEAGDLTPETYRAGIEHFLEVATDEALKQGRTPQNFGIGGLLTEGPLARGVDDPWVWSRGLKPYLYQTGFLTGAWDPYFLMRPDGTREPFRSKIDAQGSTYEKTGVSRLFIAETAQGLDYRHQRDVIVGTVTDQVHHLEQLEKWLVEKGEFGILFSKELGWMSRNGWLREAAARKAYYIGEKLNIPVIPMASWTPGPLDPSAW